MAVRHNTEYDPKYPWRPMYYFDSCPECFENFDIDYVCDNCGSGHSDHDLSEKELIINS